MNAPGARTASNTVGRFSDGDQSSVFRFMGIYRSIPYASVV